MTKKKIEPIISLTGIVVIAIISLVASLAFIRTEQYSYQESFVSFVPADAGKEGTVTEKTYGFPLIYKDKMTYMPTPNNSGTAYSIEEQGMSVPYIILNTIFLSSVSYTTISLYKQYRKK